MDALIIVAASLAGGAVLALILAIGNMLNADRHLDTRLDIYLGEGFDPEVMPEHVSDKTDEAIAAQLNTALNRVGFAEGIRRNLARADLPLTVPEYILLKIAATLLPMALVLILSRSILAALPVALIGFFLPTIWLARRRSRRQRLFSEQLPEMLDMVIGSLRGGFSLVQSLNNVAREAPEPMSSEIRRVLQEVQLGLSVSDALNNLALRMNSDDAELLVTVMRIHARIGGNLTMVLENISSTIRERGRLKREIRVITAQQRYGALVLSLLPVILALILLVLNPAYIQQLFQPGLILFVPIGAVVLNVIGFLIIQKIADIKV